MFKVQDEQYVGRLFSLARLTDLKELYNIQAKCLGEGSFGKVFLANRKSNSEDKVAIKVINKRGLDLFLIKCIMNEVKILHKVDHPNIVKYFETYDEK
jgi:calcium-dependent protein kinase